MLSEGGIYVNVEMFLMSPVNALWFKELKKVYGVTHLPDLAGWKRLYRESGFNDIQVLETRSVRPQLGMQQNQPYANEDLASPQVFENPRVIEILAANSRWLEANSRFLGYGIFVCHKVGLSRSSHEPA